MLNIYVYKTDGTWHPKWEERIEDCRESDLVFATIFGFGEGYFGKNRTLQGCVRPPDIPALRESIDNTDLENKSRYHHLLDLVENEGCWICFSW
jgi:hypothetical protein